MKGKDLRRFLKISKTMARHFLSFVLVLLVLGCGSSLFFYGFFLIQDRQSQRFRVPAVDKLSADAIEKILARTVTIETTNGSSGGSAYIDPGTQQLLTNYHVASKFCPSRNCPSVMTKLRYNQLFIDKSVVNVSRFKKCSPWLDLCHLDSDLKGDSLPLNPEGIPPAIGDELFVTEREANDSAGGLIRFGKITMVAPAEIEADLYSQKGFSGRPVFDKSGNLVGLLRANKSAGGIVFDAALALIGFAMKNWFLPTSFIVPTAAIKATVLCAGRHEQCLLAELRLFIEHFAVVMHRNANFYDRMAILPMLEGFRTSMWAQAFAYPTVDREVRLLQDILQAVAGINFNQQRFLTSQTQLYQDPFWYKVYLAALTAELSKDEVANGDPIRDFQNPPDAKLRNAAADWVDAVHILTE